MNTLHLSPNAYVDALTLPELQAELVLAASRMVGTRVVTSGLNAEFYVCRECAGRGRDRHQVQHLPDCVAGFVARLLLAVAHREAGQVSQPQRKEPSANGKSQCEPAGGARRESRPHLLPKPEPCAALGNPGWCDTHGCFRSTCQEEGRWPAVPVNAAGMIAIPLLPALYGEPWTVDAEGDVYDAEGNTVVDMYGCTLAEPDDLRAMHRIAACVNHCMGVPTEELTRETERAATGGAR